MTLTTDYAQRQRDLSRDKQADGQCLECGVFRVDGQPPTVHRHGCRRWRRSQHDVLWISDGSYQARRGRQ